MLVTALFATTAALYAVACGFFVAFLARGRERASRWAMRVLGGSVAMHVVFLGVDWAVAGHRPYGHIQQSLSLLSLFIVLTFLGLGLRYKVGVLGAFLTPVTLLFFLGSGFGRSVDEVPPEVRSLLLPVHIGVNVLGIVAFAMAFAAAVGYVLQERMLRQKKLGGVFQRLPPLDVLDSLGFRAIIIGFPLLTVGIVTGTLWAVRIEPGMPQVTFAQGSALLSWLVFAGVLLLRAAAGWRGRRAAIGTIVGFLCAAAVLVGYMVQAAEAMG